MRPSKTPLRKNLQGLDRVDDLPNEDSKSGFHRKNKSVSLNMNNNSTIKVVNNAGKKKSRQFEAPILTETNMTQMDDGLEQGSSLDDRPAVANDNPEQMTEGMDEME
jgi:hypothetical protein